MSWVAVAVGAGSIVTGYLGSQSASKAGKAAQQGSDAGIAEARRQFDLVRGDTAANRGLNTNAVGLLSRLYGYGPPPRAQVGEGMAPAQAPQIADDGYFNTGSGSILNPWTVTSKLGDAGKILDPAGGVFGNLFGNKHGDEKRNYDAFFRDNKVYDLGNGKYALGDGTTFDQNQLKDVAGTWYGATYAPDGNQGDWQQRWSTLQGRLGKTSMDAPGATAPSAAGASPDVGYGTPGKPDMSAFFESPDYQFNLAEGQKAIDRSAAARGGLLSGGAVKEGERYASGLASREYASFIDRLMQQAGLGSTGIGASASAGMQTANNVGNAAITAGNARGSAYMQGANALNNSVQGGISNLLLARYLGG
jgi:hypothetical protein